MRRTIGPVGWLLLVMILLTAQGCALTDVRKTLLEYSGTTYQKETIPAWEETELATVKFEPANRLPLLQLFTDIPTEEESGLTTVKHEPTPLPRRPISADPVGEILKEKMWDPPKVRWAVERYEYDVRRRVKADFDLAGISYPPARLALLAFKKERRLELWAGEMVGAMRRIKDYPFTAFSGVLGPKQRVGDGQIPEGIYRITYLNPDSTYHLSMKLNYPNEFDREMALRDNRTELGGDIFIHGDRRSIGCVALGDQGIEELFVLTALSGMENTQVMVAPYDFRVDDEVRPMATIPWTRELYTNIQAAVAPFHRDQEGEETFAAKK